MLYVFERSKSKAFEEILEELRSARFELVRDGGVTIVKRGGDTWAIYGCDDEECALWVKDDPSNPLVDVCFTKREESADEEKVKEARELGINRDTYLLTLADNCKGKVSFVVIPKMLGAEQLSEVDLSDMTKIVFFVFGAALLISELLELR